MFIFILAVLIAPEGVSLPKGWRLDADTDELVYKPLGISFPAKVIELHRGDPYTFDHKGLDVGLGYTSRQVPLVFTVYIYRRTYFQHESLEEHFRYCISEIQRHRPTSQVAGRGTTIFPMGSATTFGQRAFVRYKQNGQTWGSYAVLLPYGQYYVMLRASFLGGDIERIVYGVWGAANAFMESIPFPADDIPLRSRRYNPISEGERRVYEQAELDVLPDAVREEIALYRDTIVAWAGIIEKTIVEEREQYTGVRLICEHYNFDWKEHAGTHSERIFLSSEGQGRFCLYWRLKKGTPVTSTLTDVGKLLLAYGKPARLEGDVVWLEPAYIREIDSKYFRHVDEE